MFYNFRKNKKAFTVVELIVVIAIIAILGAVVGVTVATFVNRAKKTAATSPLTELADKWQLKENKTTLSQYVKELFPNDTAHFYISNQSFWDSKSFKSTDTFTIWYHDDNCGDYYGVLEVVKGEVLKTNVGDPVEGKPGTAKDFKLTA